MVSSPGLYCCTVSLDNRISSLLSLFTWVYKWVLASVRETWQNVGGSPDGLASHPRLVGKVGGGGGSDSRICFILQNLCFKLTSSSAVWAACGSQVQLYLIHVLYRTHLVSVFQKQPQVRLYSHNSLIFTN